MQIFICNNGQVLLKSTEILNLFKLPNSILYSILSTWIYTIGKYLKFGSTGPGFAFYSKIEFLYLT